MPARSRVPIHPIKTECARRGLTIRAFAEAVEVSPGLLYSVIAGRSQAWPALRRRAAKALCLPEDELFHEADR